MVGGHDRDVEHRSSSIVVADDHRPGGENVSGVVAALIEVLLSAVRRDRPERPVILKGMASIASYCHGVLSSWYW